jgi:PPOX class probable F420-dependent enzyme
MIAAIPESHLDLLTEPITVALVTMMPDGHPQCHPVWCDYDGTYIRVNAGSGRQKGRNMHRDPRVTVLAVDPQDSFRYLEVRGIVEDIVIDETGNHMNALSLQYTGKPKRYGIEAPPREVDTRIIYKIRPTRVIAR